MSSTVEPLGGDSLQHVALLAPLSEELRLRLAARANPTQLAAGEWLFRAGDPGNSLFVVLSGRLEVLIESPRPSLLRVLGRGDAFGELALLTGEPRSASVRARRDSELLELARDDFLYLLEREPDFILALTRWLGEQLRRSRALTVEPPPIPATIAVVPLQAGLPASLLAAELLSTLGGWHPAACLDRNAAEGAHDGASIAARLDRAERSAEQVLLVGEDPGLAPEWTEFCVRQADRVLALCEGGDPLAIDTLTPPLAGCDVVYCSRKPHVGLDTAAWHEALSPRASHLLPLEGGFDAAAQRIARRLAGRSVGVVLSGGGARGLSHIGVLEELGSAGVLVDRVAGCSMGSFVGALFASGADPNEIARVCQEELVARNPWSDYTIPLVAATRGRRLQEMFVRVFGSRQIQDLERAYFCVSADLMSSELVVHDRGRLGAAVAASMCIPGSAPPVVMEGHILVDGGLFDNLPVETMASFGEGPIIAVDVTAQFTPPRAARSGRPRARRVRAGMRAVIVGDEAPRPGLRETMSRSIVLGSRDTTEAAKRFADLVINPETSSIGLIAFKELERARELGRQAARRALEQPPAFLAGAVGSE
jgi:NTE family protein